MERQRKFGRELKDSPVTSSRPSPANLFYRKVKKGSIVNLNLAARKRNLRVVVSCPSSRKGLVSTCNQNLQLPYLSDDLL